MPLTASNREAIISGCPLFRGLDAQGAAAFAAVAVEVEFPPERAIARAGRDRQRPVHHRRGAGPRRPRRARRDAPGPRRVLRRAVRPRRGAAQRDRSPPRSRRRCLAVATWDAERVHARRAGGGAGGAARAGRPAARGRRRPPLLIPRPAADVRAVTQERPTGTVAFLFTDIQGSTRLVDALGTRGVAAGARPAPGDRPRGDRGPSAGPRSAPRATRSSSCSSTRTTPSAAAADAQRALAAEAWPDGADDPRPDGDPRGDGRARRRRVVRRPRRPPGGARRGRGARRAGAALRGRPGRGRRGAAGRASRPGRWAPTGSRTCGRSS